MIKQCNVNEAFEENTVNERKICRWFVIFCSRDFSLQNKLHDKHNNWVHNDALIALVENDLHQIWREIAMKMDIQR